MASLLMVVEDVIEICGRGVAVFPAAKARWSNPPRVSATVSLRRPDGMSLRATISIIEHVSTHPYDPTLATGLVFRELTRDDIPIGTEVWLEGEE